jgi:hypothetical protein
MQLSLSFHPAALIVAALVAGYIAWLKYRRDDRDDKIERLERRLSHYEDVL